MNLFGIKIPASYNYLLSRVIYVKINKEKYVSYLLLLSNNAVFQCQSVENTKQDSKRAGKIFSITEDFRFYMLTNCNTMLVLCTFIVL